MQLACCGVIVVENEDVMEIGSIMMAGVELVLSGCFHTLLWKLFQNNLLTIFGANFSIPMTETF